MSGMQQQGLGIGEERSLGSVEEYQFEPIKGYPMLQWHGKRPFRSTHFYPAQLKEVHGPDVGGWRNKIYWGDNLQVMSHLLKQYRGKVQLIYIDPPFDSKADYKLTVTKSGAEAVNQRNAFEEKQYTDIWLNDEYLQFMYERLILMRELLATDGTIYVHVDWHKSHYLRCMLDEIFGRDNFINEVIWKRANTVKGNVGQGSKFWGANTDTIFFYKKGGDYTFWPQYTDYSTEYLDQFYKYVEPSTGRRYRLISMTAPGGESKGNPSYEVMGVVRYWRYSKVKMQELIKRGLVVQTQPGNVPQRKLYLDEGQGVPVQSLWDDIPGLSSQSNERWGYPTQKPETLLERIIRASSNPGDLVFDCFMGSGTTQAVAMKLGRRFIGADINLGAVQITTKRLMQVAEDLAAKPDASRPKQAAIAYQQPGDEDELDGEDDAAPAPQEPSVYYTGFEVYNVNNYDVFRNPVQARDLLLQALEVQPLAAGSVFDGTLDGRMVKVMPVNRIATRADLNDLLANIDHKALDRLYHANPNQVVEKITLICMGHEPDLAACLKQELHPYKVDVEVVDVLRDRQDLQFKRDSEARVRVKGGKLVIEAFYPMNLLQKLSMQKETVAEWRELVESVMIDWNYDGAVLTPALVDIPERNELVSGVYSVPADAGMIRVKITDLLSESWEGTAV